MPVSTANDSLIERFYAAFAAGDGGGDGGLLYARRHPSPTRSSRICAAPEAGAMWRMLTSRATDLRDRVAGARGHGRHGVPVAPTGRAHYTFTQTGRPVVNDVRASFRFRDGLIADHRDDFSFYRWSRQALGAPGCFSAGLRCCAPPWVAAPARGWRSSCPSSGPRRLPARSSDRRQRQVAALAFGYFSFLSLN